VRARVHPREEPDLLDHVADPAPQLGQRHVLDAAAVDADVALVDRDQPVDHLQRSRLAAAGGADQRAELSRRDGQGEIGDRCGLPPRVALGDVVEHDLGGRAVHEPMVSRGTNTDVTVVDRSTIVIPRPRRTR
jgi:hypothetical protein